MRRPTSRMVLGSDMVTELSKLNGSRLCDGELSKVTFSLPSDHLTFLGHANGASAFHGYLRIFGIACATCVDLSWWNDPETWKFAWPARVSDFLFFGETAWGDQFAYDLDRLSRGDATVYFLDSFEMEPEELAPDFPRFMTDVFLPQAQHPDSMTRAAAERIGPLAWNEHVTYVPSLLLGGNEDIDHAHKLNARASMIINGDIATQSANGPDQLPSSIETYEDDRGRLRTRLVWEA